MIYEIWTYLNVKVTYFLNLLATTLFAQGSHRHRIKENKRKTQRRPVFFTGFRRDFHCFRSVPSLRVRLSFANNKTATFSSFIFDSIPYNSHIMAKGGQNRWNWYFFLRRRRRNIFFSFFLATRLYWDWIVQFICVLLYFFHILPLLGPYFRNAFWFFFYGSMCRASPSAITQKRNRYY